MRNKLLFAGAALLYAVLNVLPANAADEKSILELYTLAKAKDPVVGKAEARFEGGKADQEITWAALLPRISASASQRQMWHTVLNYGPTTVEGSYAGFSYGISGQLPIINIPSYLQVAAADAGLRSAEAGTTAAQQDLIVRLVSAYVALLKAQADEKLYRDELARVGKILEQAEAFLKAGTGDIIAVYEARARMDSAAADLIKTEAQRRIAEQTLSSLTGVVITTVKDIPVTNPAGPQPNDLSWWLDTMQKKNPSIKQAKEDLVQAGHYSDTNRASHLPTVQLSGGYTVDKGSTFLPEVETKQWYISASLSFPIYSGGEIVARTRKAVAGESERRFMLEDAVDQNTKRLKEAFLNLQYNVSLADAYKRKYESSDLQLNATRKGREIGTRTAIDLLNAEQTWAVSRRDLTNALYDNLLRRLELKAAAGLLAESDLRGEHED
ncbi:MAG: TolC family protein [Geobacter sp.]|nr:TolC family protein [Geobacter sp.]